MEAEPTRVITHKPRGRNDDVNDEFRQPHRTPTQTRHRVGSRTTSEDVQPRPSVRYGRVWNDSVPVQPKFTLLDPFEFVKSAVPSTSPPTYSTLRRFMVRVSPPTLRRVGGRTTTTPSTRSRNCPNEVK